MTTAVTQQEVRQSQDLRQQLLEAQHLALILLALGRQLRPHQITHPGRQRVRRGIIFTLTQLVEQLVMVSTQAITSRSVLAALLVDLPLDFTPLRHLV